MLACLKYDKILSFLPFISSLSELLPGQNGDEERNIKHHDV